MRIIHTSDIHLDACFAGVGMAASFGNRRRQSLREVFRAIVRRAGEWPADALIIAGDLFEQERISRDTVAFLRAEFQTIPDIPVFIAPGNHDPFTARSVYATQKWPDNVIVFSEADWQTYEQLDIPLTVHGFAFDGPDVSANPFGSLRVPQDGRVHIAVGHGSEMGNLPPGKGSYAPFRVETAVTEGLAYLALGHYHAMKRVEGPFDTQVYYSGSPEGQGFGETGIHYYLEVEIEAGNIRVTPVPSCRVEYVTCSMPCSDLATSQEVIDALRAIGKTPGGLPRIARITLTGTCAADLQEQMTVIRDAVASDFEHLELRDETTPPEDIESLADTHTSLGAFVGRITGEIRDTADPERRRMLERAREVGLAAYRGQDLSIQGGEGA